MARLDEAYFEKVSYEQFRKDYKRIFFNIFNDDGTDKDGAIEEAYENIVLPQRSTSGSAGYDICSPVGFTLSPYADGTNEYSSKEYRPSPIVIPTGIRVHIPEDYALIIVPRSGLGFKYGFRLSNSVGVIDSDYYHSSNEGHIQVSASITIPNTHLTVNPKDRICQGIFLPYGITRDDNCSSTRDGGFGSTGK